jgi:ApeA N-terminal domain 1
VFWQIETPERRVPGQLELSDGATPVLETVGRIFDERAYRDAVSQHGGVTISNSGNPDDLVADFQPRNINGELNDGRQVSLIEAQGGADPNSFVGRHYRQRFRARHAVMDEHVDGAAQRYAGFKFYLTGSSWWRRPDEEAQTDDGSHLRLTWEEDSRSFEFCPASPLTFREVDSAALSPITTLASLVTNNPADVGDLHVRLADDGQWRKVYAPEEPIGRTSHPLLNTMHLTADRFAKWIDLRKRTRGLDAAAIAELEGVAIQTEVLALAAVAEGLHRKLFDDKKRVPALEQNDVRQARRAARKVALDSVRDADRSGRPALTGADLAEFKQAINDAFSFLNEPTFRSRMTDLIEDAQSSIPNIAVNFRDWPAAVKHARDTLAHE